ncbi:MAG: hypothetical protein ABIJ47_04750 [Candidatus Bathyarchaeota archaeon]
MSKTSPAEAKRRATVKVLQLFKNNPNLKWSELWDKAKTQRITYSTCKRVVKRSLKAGLLKPNILEDINDPVLTLVIPLPQLLYLSDIIGFLTGCFEDWNKHPDIPNESFIGSTLFSDVSWNKLKKYVTREDEMRLKDAQMALFDIRQRMALDTFTESEKKLILSFEEKIKELVNQKNQSRERDKTNNFIAMIAELQGLDPDEEIKKEEGLMKEMDTALLSLYLSGDSDDFFSFLFKGGEIPDEARRLMEWLEENRGIYREYSRKQREQPKILFSVGVGFEGYEEESGQLGLQLPPAWFASEKMKTIIDDVEADLDRFGNRSTLYRCELCKAWFDNKKKAEDHVRFDHENEEVGSHVSERHKSFYSELLKNLMAV